ncbi:Uncharacterised protein [Vibrio cholerae]|nr:Uncharacterised protein [Vibrio cholerae]
MLMGINLLAPICNSKSFGDMRTLLISLVQKGILCSEWRKMFEYKQRERAILCALSVR